MRGRNYGTMNHGYYYDEGKRIGYDISVNNLHFHSVAYHSKKQLIEQLTHDGYKVDNIVTKRHII